MKSPLASLPLLCLLLMAIPAAAQNVVYDNGPVNGQEVAWTINFGFIVTNSFTISNGASNINGMDFWAWLFPGDTMTSVEIQIGDGAFGNNLMDLTVDVSASDCFTNQFGYNVCMESANFSGPHLTNGAYWVSLGNAMIPSGDPAFWDMNSGAGCQSLGCPSLAFDNSLGTLPSESFTILGQSSTSTGTTPEPGSILLLASGVLGLAGILRRKLL